MPPQIPRSARRTREPERLVRAYADLVLRVCYTYLRSTADAEDVCQDNPREAHLPRGAVPRHRP